MSNLFDGPCTEIKQLRTAANYYANLLANKCGDVPEVKGCNPTPPRPLSYHERMQAKKKEKDMQYGQISLNPTIRVDGPPATFNAIQTAQDHLTDRLSEATEAKRSEARKAFGLENDDRPSTAKAFVDRITSGKFYIPEDRKNQYSYDPTDYIQWRDPAIKRDEDGFQKAVTALEAASDDVLDNIIVKGNDAGLDAIKEFKAKTFH
jgi:hypothetical protein